MNLALYPTLVTPFRPDNQIDYPSLDRLIDHLFRNHCDGLFAVCQSSEMFYLSDEEKLALASFCIDRSHMAGRKCVVSGHTQTAMEKQLDYLLRLEQLGADALILVTNRLAGPDEDDNTLIRNLDHLIKHLDPQTRLGLYECPFPYKRLLSTPVVSFLVETGRFDFIKDTCCQISLICDRLRQIRGSTIRLYNANAATLMESLEAGASGYSGVMLNFVPELFTLARRYLADETASASLAPLPEHLRSAQEIMSFITLASVYEYQKYPLNAKHFLMRKGLFQSDLTRCLPQETLTESQKKELQVLANQCEKRRCKADLAKHHVPIFPDGMPFRSCHASSLLPFADGTILVAFFAGTDEGAHDVGIWLSRREDGVWISPVRVAKVAEQPHWNPVLFQDGPRIRLYFKVGEMISSWRSYTMTSENRGKTWSAPVACTPDNAAGGPVRSKPIRLGNGQLLAPNSDETSLSWQPRVDLSEDGGASFRQYAQIPLNLTDPLRDTYLSGKGAIQPALWESGPGQVHLLLRTTAGYLYRSDSDDNGQTWCEAYNTGLPNNNSAIEVVRHGGTLYLIMNPISGNWGSRNPLVIRKSLDNGRSFDHFLTLAWQETDPLLQTDAEYSYPSAVVQDDRLYVTYTYLRRQIAFHEIDLTFPSA